ncbi:MAG: hypothetical protein KH828_00335 [Clostridiales bacterium]|nr:hypothetical protein [Clostridiales bacterium]
MEFGQPLPFYMTYPFIPMFDQEMDQEKDLQVMKSYYSRRAARIQEKVERECDRMEYNGSMMYDEYPDKFMMEHLCRKIEKEVMEDAMQDGEEDMDLQSMQRGRGNDMRDLIGVLLFNEMFRRRCRHRRCRRFF